MSAGDEWANDATPRERGCLGRALAVGLAAVALAAVAGLALLGGNSEASTPTVPAPPLPITGVVPSPAPTTGVCR
jgi:hypothetical protein